MKAQAGTVPVYFTGEMVSQVVRLPLLESPDVYLKIFPDMFDDYANLRPWKGAAEILAKDTSWPPIYDLEQLAKNEVKVSAVT